MANLTKNIFISWTSNDKIEITKYIEAISNKTGLSYYFSDNDCIGNFEEWFEKSISNAPFFLSYITKDSVLKEYCQKEVEEVIKKYKKYDYKFITFISELKVEEINKLEKTNPFYQLINECKVSGVFTENKDFESVVQEVSDKLEIMTKYYDLLSYSNKLNDELDQFMILGDNKIYSLDEMYIERVLLDESNEKEVDEQTLLDKKIVLIKGEAGSGKTLYVKKLAKKLNKEDGYVYILQNTDVKEIIKNDRKIIEYLYEKLNSTLLSQKDFQIIMKNNKNYIIVEGLDEVISRNKNKLITKLTEFKNEYDNFHLIFTSRNDENINDCFKVNLSPLNQNRIEETAKKYIHIYANEDEKEKEFYLALDHINDEIKANPLLLSQLAFIYSKKNKMPDNKFELYNEITNLIIKDLNVDNIESNLNDTIQDFIKNNKRILSKCAYNLVINKENNNYTFYEALSNSLDEPDEVDDIYKYLKTRCIITKNDEFYHKTFLEYFASVYIFNYSNSFTNDDILGYIPNDKLNRIINAHDISEIYEMLLLIIDNKCAEEGIKKSLELIVGEKTNKYFHLLNVLKQKKFFGRYLLKPIYNKVVNKEAHPYHELLYYTVKNDLFTELLLLVDDSKNLNYQYAFIQDIICLYSDINILNLKKDYITNINKLENDNTKRYENLIAFYNKGIKNVYFYYEKDEYDIYKINDEKLIGHIIVDNQIKLKGKVTKDIIGLSVLNDENFESEWDCYYKECIKLYILPFGLKQINGSKISELITRIVIPNSVTSIGDCAFYGCSGLTSIEIPDSVTTIEKEAFSVCNNLTSIEIPNSVVSIGDCAFYGCSGLTSIEIPDSVTTIEKEAFSWCSLTSIVIPNSVTRIGDSAFSYCSSLTSIEIPNSVASIGKGAFVWCSNLENVYYKGTIEDWCNIEFGEYSSNPMEYAKHLYLLDENNNWYEPTEIVLKEGMTEIKKCTFYGCSKLKSIEIPDSVTTIGDSTFFNCSSLTSFTIGNNVKIIGNNVFSGCNSLTNIYYKGTIEGWCNIEFGDYSSNPMEYAKHLYLLDENNNWYEPTEVVLKEGMTEIKKCTFYGCSNLANIEIPDSVTSIGEDAFEGCSSLTNVYYKGTIEDWYSIEFGDYTSNPMEYAKHLYLLNENNNWYELTEIVLKEGMTEIKKSTFLDCINQTSVEIPDSVTSIGECAFSDCINLTSIEIPNSVASIGKGAFVWCSNLENVYYKGTIEDWCNIEFGEYSSNPMGYAKHFYLLGENNTWYEPTKIELKEGITEIKEYAFYEFNQLISIKIPESVTSIGFRAFEGCSNLTSIAIPNSAETIGDYAFEGCSSLTSITIPESVTSIGGRAFRGCSSLTSIVIPNSVTTIGKEVFSWCSSLTSIEIPNSVETIEESAFRGCSSLTSIVIPDSVTTIGKEAFSWCSSLTSIEIPNSVETIEESTFSDCSSLTSITIPESVTSIGGSAFRGCSSLTSIVIPDSVTTIGKQAFYSCASLTDATIGNSVISIGDWAFKDCSSLTSITIPNSLTSIEHNAFSDCNSLTNVYYKGTIETWINIDFSCNPMYYAKHLYLLDENNNWYEPTEIVLKEGMTEIKEYLFSGYSKLTNIAILDGVTCIGHRAFKDCSSLTNITIPDSVTSIGYEAFYGCSSLIKLKISENFIEEFTNYFDTEAIIKRYNEKKYRKEDGYIIFD